MIRLLNYALVAIGSKHRNSLSVCRDKAVYFRPYLDIARSLVHWDALFNKDPQTVGN